MYLNLDSRILAVACGAVGSFPFSEVRVNNLTLDIYLEMIVKLAHSDHYAIRSTCEHYDHLTPT